MRSPDAPMITMLDGFVVALTQDIVLIAMLYEQPRLYDTLYDRFKEDIPFYIDLARRVSGPVCELACGSGRIAVPMAQAGLSVTGVDVSPLMVAAARHRADEAQLGSNRPLFAVGDMREPQGEFSLVIVALHSLSLLTKTDDILSTLRSIHDSLTPRGEVVLALHNPDLHQLSTNSEGLERIHEEVSSVTLYETRRYHPDTQILDVKWYLETHADTTMIPFSLRMIFPEELLLFLKVCGFELVERWGWYDRAPFTAQSGTQIVVARRR